MSLFNRGYEEAEKKQKEQEARQTNKVRRFWIPRDSTTTVVFLDDNPPVFEEHQRQIGGSWQNWDTCKRQFGETCTICDNGTYAYTAGAYTILNRNEWTSKRSGKTYKDTKELFIAKMDTLKKLKQISKKRGGLRGCVFEITRSDSDKSPSTGDMFDFEEKLTEDQLKEMFGGEDGKGHLPLNYDELLAPKDDSEINSSMDQEASDQYEEEENIKF